MTHNYYQRHIKPTDANVGMLLIITYNWNVQMTDSQIRFKVKVLITLHFGFFFIYGLQGQKNSIFKLHQSIENFFFHFNQNSDAEIH